MTVISALFSRQVLLVTALSMLLSVEKLKRALL